MLVLYTVGAIRELVMYTVGVDEGGGGGAERASQYAIYCWNCGAIWTKLSGARSVA